MRTLKTAAVGLMLGAAPIALVAPAWAQDAAPGAGQDAPAAPEQDPADEDRDDAAAGYSEENSEDQIVVTGQRLRGAVVGDIEPELTLDPADIRAYGVSTIGELVAELAPQTRSGRGRGGGGGPVILLGGRRISSFRELRDLPAEAIERVDILPEEVALKYGYRADQRVVNIVLRERFRSITAELEGRVPTQGGNANIEGEVGIARIGNSGRINFNVKYETTSAILESERDVLPTRTTLFDPVGNVTAPGGTGEIDPALSALAGTPVTVAGVPAGAASGAPTLPGFAANANVANQGDIAASRTLVSPNQQLEINSVISRNLSERVTGTVNIGYDVDQSEALLGPVRGALIVPAGNPYSPFSTDVLLSRYYDSLLPLSRASDSRTFQAGFGLNGDSSNWRWSVTGNFTRTDSETVTETGIDTGPLQAALYANDPAFNPFGALALSNVSVLPADLSNSRSNNGSLTGQIGGTPLRLPAGELRTNFRIGASTLDLESNSLRGGVATATSNSRDIVNGQLNIDVPITSRREFFLDAIGDISLNGNVEVERLSDFDTLITRGYGARWEPIDQVRFLVSITDEEGAPSPQQLGNPIVSTPNVRVFDYTRGETVDVTSITGGNPNLGADSRHVVKFGVNVSPIDDVPLNLSADYVHSTTRNDIAAFPAVTAEVEAAFPDRFVRDGSGRLLQVDSRPVNFARTERSELRWGMNLFLPVGEARPQEGGSRFGGGRRPGGEGGAPRGARPEGTPPAEGQAAPREGGSPPAGGQEGSAPPPQSADAGRSRGRGGRSGGGGRGGFGRGDGRGRLQFSVYHTWHFKNEVLIREGLPVLDYLDGAAAGNSGGQPRHEVELQTGFYKNGFGARVEGNWQSGTSVASGAIGSGDRLDFSPRTTLDLRLFVNFTPEMKVVRDHRWLRGGRIVLSVDNVFDNRLRVTDSTGAVPLSYQPDLLDPTGRTVRISFRKLFF